MNTSTLKTGWQFDFVPNCQGEDCRCLLLSGICGHFLKYWFYWSWSAKKSVGKPSFLLRHTVYLRSSHDQNYSLGEYFFMDKNYTHYSKQELSFRIPYHILHLLCKCLGRSLNVPIESLLVVGYSKRTPKQERKKDVFYCDLP